MTDSDNPALRSDQIRVYIGDGGEAGPALEEAEDAFTPQGGFGKPKAGVKTVTISDDELADIRTKVNRILGALATPDGGSAGGSYATDTVTLHLGITVGGHFFFPQAGLEAALDVTWKRT